MQKKFMRATALFFACAMAGTSLAADKLSIGTEGDYAPFNYVTAGGEIKGFDYDIGQAVCAEIKVECVWSTNEWSGIIPALQAKKFDVMIASMAINEDRKKEVDFTKPYYFNAMRFIARKDLGLTDVSPEALKGKVIGTQSGSVAVEALQEFFPDSEVKLYPTLSEVFLDMANGRLDLILEGQMALTDWLAKDDSGCCDFVGDSFILDTAQGNAMAVRKGNEELLGKLNGGLEAIMVNGTYDKIRKQYFDFDIMARPKSTSEYFR
ncbi:polar amino acid transport system substrate-binding protein [Ensifer adhaerens]|uniref:Polar amino acid transport system substrate-binding protein n=1 Tax=Ensifer adhaerens TaxID=106592 RepID=A0ACC5SZ90_ENSAD|nr:transporter substrate-binding domain-containing protein [Ensifer adhaerens]MBP1873979.1 polar amino acid transport system substrate-binding protein [Ensifer adhaerens]